MILPQAPIKKVLPLTHVEQERLENACASDRLGHLIVFLLRIVLRMSALCNLKWEDCDETNGVIYSKIKKQKRVYGWSIYYLRQKISS